MLAIVLLAPVLLGSSAGAASASPGPSRRCGGRSCSSARACGRSATRAWARWRRCPSSSAWGLQWISCYILLAALGLDGIAGLGAAAAVLFAVNVTAVVPATPSNLGVFQAACVAVLGAYGVAAADALAYGIILQAVEIATAVVMGAPALVKEGMSWRDVRLRAMHATPVELPPLHALIGLYSIDDSEFGGHPRMSLPVEVLGEHRPGALEALILSLDEESPGEVRVDLVLSRRRARVRCLQAFDVAWLGARVGDIVWVRQAASAACF